MRGPSRQGKTPRPLDGIRVVELGGWLAGPLAGKLLADLGAEVSRISPPGRPRLPTALDAELSAPKAVETLDLRDPDQRDMALRWIGQADVVIENGRPGSMVRIGIDPDQLCVLHPRLIWLSLPGFASSDAELRDVPAWEGVLAGACGLFTNLSLTRGLAGLPPAYTSLPLASVYGAVHGALGVMAALLARERDGVGDQLEVPLASSLMAAMGSMLFRPEAYPPRYEIPPLPPRVKSALPRLQRLVARAPGRIQEAAAAVAGLAIPPLMDSFRCSDTRLLYVFGIDHDRIPLALLEVTGVLGKARKAGLTGSDLYGPARRDNYLDAMMLTPLAQLRLRRSLRTAFAARSSEEWEEKLVAAGVPCSTLRTSAEWALAPEVQEAGLIVGREGGLAPGPPLWFAAPRGVGAEAPPAGATHADVALPLADVRVIDFSSMVAGPTAGRTLAELGAEVVKVDPPRPHHGPRMVCWYGIDLNRGKRSMLLDLRRPSGLAAARSLIAEADVVVENIRPGVLRDLGLDPDEVRTENPRLNWCSLGAFNGPDGGPWAGRHGYDPVLQAATGVMLRYGGGKPELHGVASCVDALTGYLAALGAVAALLSRTRGHGSLHAQTSLAAAAQLAQIPFMIFPAQAAAAPRQWTDGPRARGKGPLQRLYEARDGWLFLGARPDQAQPIADALGVTGDARRLTNDDRLAAALAAAIRRLPRERAVELVRAAGGGAHAVTTLAEIRAAGPGDGGATFRIDRDEAHPAGTPVETAAPTYLRSRRMGNLRSGTPAPKFGLHTREILQDLVGDDPAEALITEGAAAEQITDEYLPV